jgi:diaminohydroxyphosphoribosylaminopyrimidine deaminase / 5-amino-6-(5-phosphoribosylamino)uracil reductase
MRRAVALANRIPSSPSPNPRVGAIVLDAAGILAGQGAHLGAGTPHAERVALSQAGEAARGGTLIVTLSPCTRFGRTPPCVDAVIAAGVKRVIIGTIDPSPDEGDRSLEALQAAGIEVITGVLQQSCDELIAGFRMRVVAGRPRVTLKLAISLDGRIAAADGSSRWVTGPGARRDAHRLRADSDAIIVGSGTALADDPSLTVRLKGRTAKPLRILLDAQGKVAPTGKLFDSSAPTLVATTNKSTEAARNAWEQAGAEVVEISAHDGRVDLSELLTALGSRGLNDVLFEGGSVLAGSLVENRLVDRFVVYVAPKLLGAHGTAAVGGLVIGSIDQAVDLQFTSIRRVGADLRLEGQLSF